MDTFCKIYLSGNIGLADLISAFVKKFGGERELSRVEFATYDVVFALNTYYDPLQPDNISLSQYYMDLEFAEDARINECVKITNAFFKLAVCSRCGICT